MELSTFADKFASSLVAKGEDLSKFKLDKTQLH